MTEHARDLIDRFRLGQQSVEYVDAPARQRDRVDIRATRHTSAQWQRQFGRRLQSADELFEGGARRDRPRGVPGATFERLSVPRGVEHLPYPRVDGGAK